ncbi:MAG: pilus assembly protein PilM [Kiritimatiellae bacterium]|nr:pilus assembly protein PilM [Kiritimatiellia bacterium]
MSSKGKRTVIELGTERVKLAEFAVRSGSVTLTKFHVCEAPAEGSFEEALTDAVEVHGFDTHHVIGCLPRNMVTVRMFDLPSMDLAEIAGMVDLQFGKQVPYSRDEVVADYRVLKPRDGYTRVVLVVIQRGPLRECFNLVDAVGIDIETMTIGSDGLAQWAAGRSAAMADQAEAVLDIDTGHADLVVTQDGELQYTRSILVGAEQLEEDEARWCENLASETQQALEICRAESPELEVARLLLTGYAKVPDALVEALGGSLQVPVEYVSLGQSLQDDPSGVDLEDAVGQTVAITAMAGVARDADPIALKLFPEATLRVRSMISRAKALTLLGVLLVAALFSGSFYGISKYVVRRAQAGAVRAEVERTKPSVQRVGEMQAVINTVSAREDARFSAVSLLGAVHAAVPEDVHFDAVDVDMAQELVTLRGAGPTRREVRELVNNLEKSPLLADVKESGGTTRDRDGRFRFQIMGKFETGTGK